MSRYGRIALLCVVMATGSAGATEPDPPPVPERIVHFYAEELDQSLLLMTAGELLVEQCKGKIRAQCSDSQRKSADHQPSTRETLSRTTLFGKRVAVSLDKPVASYEDMMARLQDIAALLLTSSDRYERKLFARFGAILQVCPQADADEYRKDLTTLTVLDLYRFPGTSLEEFAKARYEIRNEEAALAEHIRKEWSMEDCKAAFGLGQSLLQHMYTKVEPWMTDPELQIGNDERRGRDGEFLVLVAYELELRVKPQVRTQFAN